MNLKHWNPDYDPLIVGSTVYHAFSLSRQIHKSINKNERLENEVLEHAARFTESLDTFGLSLKEAREELIPSDMDEDFRLTFERLIVKGKKYLEFTRFLLIAFVELCARDKIEPGQQGFEDFFVEGFLGVRDQCQWDATQSLIIKLNKWVQVYEDWRRGEVAGADGEWLLSSESESES